MRTLMIVEDTSFMRTILKEMLKDLNLKIVGEAVNGVEAVALYKKFRPDLVTMDITMPEMNGVEALRQIRFIDPKAKVIMCSAMSYKHMVIEALAAGATDFVTKPFQKERIVEAVQKTLARP